MGYKVKGEQSDHDLRAVPQSLLEDSPRRLQQRSQDMSPTIDPSQISIILPAKNEARGLRVLLPGLQSICPGAEIIVVDSGSADETAEVAREHGTIVVRQPYAYGNGAAVKAGIRAATRDILLLMDADGQHDPKDIPRMIERFSEGFDMTVGARNAASHASGGRKLANIFYNKFASWMVNHPVLDLTSGFRLVKAKYAREFLHLFPNGFSYPTTITIAFFRSGLSVSYVPVRALEREGKSHIRPLSDGIRFLIIIFKVGTLYSPLKVFIPASLFNLTIGLCYYLYTYTTTQRLTNMTVILISISVLIFLIGLLSEQITTIYYGIRSRAK